jgi:uncharacterized membrane protein
MHRLTAMILPLVGVLYPFIVYFGMDHVSTPVFALVLGALWLIRAPALVREPGGTWMLGFALAYCVALAVTDDAIMLRWYPVLISLVLLFVFGGSLVWGPPLIERIARLREPDLPPEGIRHTRCVTWVWCGFFVFNAGASTVLTLWAPLNWWTLYNGIIAYAIMGVLFGGEWLLRKRLRRRLA